MLNPAMNDTKWDELRLAAAYLGPVMAIEHRIKTIERENGTARLFIIERDDGCFRFEGEAEFEQDGEVYWGPSDISGIYASAEDAERSARREVLWLRDQTSDEGRPAEP